MRNANDAICHECEVYKDKVEFAATVYLAYCISRSFRDLSRGANFYSMKVTANNSGKPYIFRLCTPLQLQSHMGIVLQCRDAAVVVLLFPQDFNNSTVFCIHIQYTQI